MSAPKPKNPRAPVFQRTVHPRPVPPAQPGSHSAALVLLLLLVVAACLVAVWLWTGRHEHPKGQRGRLREFAWSAGVVAVAAIVTANLYRPLARGGYWWVLLLIPLAAALVILLRPGLAATVVPVSLIVLGLTGLGIARVRPGSIWLSGYGDGFGYGVARVGDPVMAGLILTQAYLALLVGTWLAWRELTSRPAAARAVLGRMAAPGRPQQRWGLLLLPISVMAAELVGSDAWLGLMLALLAVSMLIIRRSPRLASRLATAGLIALGLVGLLLVKGWFASGWGLSAGLFAGGDKFFAAVDATGPAMAYLAQAEAIALIGFGCWLVPRTFPEVRRLLGLAPDAELTMRVERLTKTRAVAVDTAAADLRRLERDLHDGAQARLVALGMNLRAAERLIHTSPDAAAALVAEARETSARALTELRELVRGVHPPVLADRGLGDAVRALALDCPLQVETDIDMPGRLPAPVETACYFAVAEVLTNAAKHSGSRTARVVMAHSGGRLRIEITDFGLGGADPSVGSGLAGVERRLATFDGILAMSSPVGGPTIVVLEVPCVLSSPKTSSC